LVPIVLTSEVQTSVAVEVANGENGLPLASNVTAVVGQVAGPTKTVEAYTVATSSKTVTVFLKTVLVVVSMTVDTAAILDEGSQPAEVLLAVVDVGATLVEVDEEVHEGSQSAQVLLATVDAGATLWDVDVDEDDTGSQSAQVVPVAIDVGAALVDVDEEVGSQSSATALPANPRARRLDVFVNLMLIFPGRLVQTIR
jgi:hypothetical protein